MSVGWPDTSELFYLSFRKDSSQKYDRRFEIMKISVII